MSDHEWSPQEEDFPEAMHRRTEELYNVQDLPLDESGLIEARRCHTSVHQVHDVIATSQGGIDLTSRKSFARAPGDAVLESRRRLLEAGSRQGDDVVILCQAAAYGGTDGTAGAGNQDSVTIPLRPRQRLARPSDFIPQS